MTRRVVGPALELLVPVAVVAAWWAWSTSHRSLYFPPVPEIGRAFRHDWLFARAGSDLAPSLRRMAIGWGIAIALGVAAGTVLGLSRVSARATAPLVGFLRSIPPPALIPFGIVVLGVGDTAKIFLIAFVCVWPILLSTIDGVAGIEPTVADTARSYRLRPLDRLVFVVLPAASPQVFAGLRTSLSLGIIMMVISEMVASTNGVGYFIVDAQRSFAIPEMWGGIVMLGILGYVLNLLFGVLERRALRWHRGARGRAEAA